MPRRFAYPLAALVTLALLSIAPSTIRADAIADAFTDASFATRPAPPARIQIAWLDGRTLEQAMGTGAVLLDRFPDAVIVSDPADAQTLAAAGFRVEAPIALPANRMITLLRDEGHGDDARGIDPREFERFGAQILWHRGDNLIVASDGPLPEEGSLLIHHRKALRSRPMTRRSRIANEPKSPELPRTTATTFAPVIQEMVDQISGTAFIQWIGQMAGRYSTTVGGLPFTFLTRATNTSSCDKAEQWVYERFQAMGYTQVQYDPFSFSSVNARNVVATLPGTSNPGRVVILGAHLDSTSPQSPILAPGANDNASGVAGLLMAAQILRQYPFRNTIRFIAFTGEEQGLYGSEHYAAAAAARGDSIVGVVILDMIGWKNVQNQIDIEGEPAWLPLMNVMNDACAEYTALNTSLVLSSFGSDHVPFQDEGFSSFLAIESEYPIYPCYHKTCDTTGLNQEVFGAETIRASLATVAHVAVPRSFEIVHTELPSTENETGPYEVIADIIALAPLEPDSLLLHWAADGPYIETPMLPTGTPGRYHAFIPGQTGTQRITYWLSGVDTAGRTAVHPPEAPDSTHAFWVGPRSTLLAEGFETGAPGWTHGGTADEWQIAGAAGLVEDPTAAYAGTQFAGTDITGLGANLGRYEPNTESWFESPPIDCSQAAGVRLSFARDLAMQRSQSQTWDWARVLVNGTTVWQSPSDANLNDATWALQEYDISAIADGNPAVRVRFTLHSDATVHYGGWNLDDVQLTGISSVPTTGVADGDPSRGVVLFANVPNPGRAGTTLRFALPSAAFVDLSIYDVRGRLVRTVAHGTHGAGTHSAVWDGRANDGAPASAGVYFYRLAAGSTRMNRKMVLVR